MNYSQKRDMWAIVSLCALCAGAIAAGLGGCDSRQPTLAEAQAVVASAGHDGSTNNPIPIIDDDHREGGGYKILGYYCSDGHVYRFMGYHIGFLPVFNDVDRAKPCK